MYKDFEYENSDLDLSLCCQRFTTLRNFLFYTWSALWMTFCRCQAHTAKFQTWPKTQPGKTNMLASNTHEENHWILYSHWKAETLSFLTICITWVWDKYFSQYCLSNPEKLMIFSEFMVISRVLFFQCKCIGKKI